MGIFSVLMTDRAVRLSQDHLTGLVTTPKLTPGASFRARFDMTTPPTGGVGGPGTATDDASRTAPHWTVAFEDAGEELIAGDRLQVTSRSYGVVTVELAEKPYAHAPLFGNKMAAFTVQTIKVSDLYPKLATLRALGGAVIQADIPLGLWASASGQAQPAGEVYDYDAETPYRYLALTRPRNRELLVDGAVYKIVESTPHRSSPRVTLRLRHSASGG